MKINDHILTPQTLQQKRSFNTMRGLVNNMLKLMKIFLFDEKRSVLHEIFR